jgi:mannose/fructose/N-acetylgalactosamine-specific phosphotransferase system component IID
VGTLFEKQRKKKVIFIFSVTPVLKILYIEKKDIVNQIK